MTPSLSTLLSVGSAIAPSSLGYKYTLNDVVAHDRDPNHPLLSPISYYAWPTLSLVKNSRLSTFFLSVNSPTHLLFAFMIHNIFSLLTTITIVYRDLTDASNVNLTPTYCLNHIWKTCTLCRSNLAQGAIVSTAGPFLPEPITSCTLVMSCLLPQKQRFQPEPSRNSIQRQGHHPHHYNDCQHHCNNNN